MAVYAFILCVALISSFSTAAHAELDVDVAISAEKSWPDTIVLDWQTLNIDADQKRLFAKDLKQSQTDLTKKILGSISPKSLDTFAPNIPTNDAALRRSLSTSLAGQRSSSPIIVVPAWTSLRGNQVFMLIVADSRTNVVLGNVHEVVSADVWRKIVPTKSALATLTDIINRLWNKYLQNPNKQANPDIAVGLNLATVSDRINEIERNALNLIFAAQHLASYTVVNPLAQESLATIHRAWQASGLLRRPNRNLTFVWTYPESTARQTLPLKLSLLIKPTEGVFAQPLTWQTAEDATLNLTTDKQLTVSISSTFEKQLAVEEKALNRKEKPMASKIYGAWVYLDKGRAWGLKMNDRLVIADGSSTIKGHVVGYFGPEMQLKSPRGYLIHEGAIMFVRKGQHNAKIGEEFAYDTMEAPTAWPPKQTTER